MIGRMSILLLVFSSLQVIQAENPTCRNLDMLRRSLEEKPYISLDFRQSVTSDIFETVDTVRGSLWAGQAGRFRLESPNQVIVSNGILYWSYSPENKQVLVDSVAKMGDWDPLTLLYDPDEVYECIAEDSAESKIVFTMKARGKGTDPKTFELAVSLPNFVPKKITYNDINGSYIEIYIDNLKKLVKLPIDRFTFSIPRGVDVIEMP